MKKVLSSVAMCLLIVSCLCMVACSPAGTYKFYRLNYEENGMVVDVKAGESFMGVTITENFMTLQLNKDGTGIISAQGEVSQITWVKEGDVIKVASNGEVQEFRKSGNKLTISVDGGTIVLKK